MITGLRSTTGIYQRLWTEANTCGQEWTNNQFKLCLLPVFLCKDLQKHGRPICLHGLDSSFPAAIMEWSSYNHLAYKAPKCLLSGISQKKLADLCSSLNSKTTSNSGFQKKKRKNLRLRKNPISWYFNTGKYSWYVLYEYVKAYAWHFSTFKSLNSWEK